MIRIQKQLLVKEDMELGYGKVAQLRTIDGIIQERDYFRINAGVIPALDVNGDIADVQVILDTKLSSTAGDLRYAQIAGTETITFMVAPPVNGNQAVPKDFMDSAIAVHASKTDNPHQVTKAQVGLSNVDNTADINKPISSVTQDALDNKLDNSHALDNGNPHNVTKDQLGLDAVDNTSDVNKPISSATQDALDTKLTSTHALEIDNPHAVTAVQVGALPITGGDTTGEIYVNGNLVYHAGNYPPLLKKLMDRIAALEAKLND